MKVKVTVRKDNWIPSRPWCADLETEDGFRIKGWMSSFKTKRDMIREILAVKPNAEIVG